MSLVFHCCIYAGSMPPPGMLQSTSEFLNPAMNPQYSQPQQLHRGYLQTSSQSQCQGIPWYHLHAMSDDFAVFMLAIVSSAIVERINSFSDII